MDSHRRRSRVAGGFEGELRMGGQRLAMRTVNLSLHGALCRFAPPRDAPRNAAARDAIAPGLAAGEACVVIIRLADDLDVRLEGKLVRLAEAPGQPPALEAAVDFTAMDPDSYAHLRNMVRYSAPDPDAIDEEETRRPFLS